MLESIEKMRVYAQRSKNLFYQDVLDRLDEIEREIAERYMLLPVDADGVPIHVGDYLQLGDMRGEVVALTYCPPNGKLSWEWQCDTGDWYNTAFAHHAKPRTVENVLRDFGVDAAHELNANPNATISEATIAKYADKMRELLGSDAE